MRDFLENLFKESGLDKVPTLNAYFGEHLPLVLSLPEKVDRTGVARGEIYPLARKKALLALLLFVNPKLSLKDFSESLKASYSSTRIWAREPRVLEAVTGHVEDFSERYVSEFFRLTREYTAEGLVDEAKFYVKQRDSAFRDGLNFKFKRYKKVKVNSYVRGK